MAIAWTDESRAAVVAAYLAAEPTAETSVEITKDIGAEFEQSPNGVRMILSKAGVYIASAKAKPAGKAGEKTTTPRVSKADSQEALSAAIEAAGGDVDDEIIGKLTGKAAVYFTGVINKVVASTE